MKDYIYESDEAVHDWFGLSYCSYLVLPRSVLQSMSPEWQRQFISLIQEIQETLDVSDMPSYTVNARDENNKFIHDPFQDYQRGRRKIEHKLFTPQKDGEG